MRCGKCGSEDSVKAGFNHGRQRHKCKVCGRQFTMEEDRNAQNRARALYLYVTGLSMRAIARAFGVAPSTVLYWVRNFALRAYGKPTPQGPVVVELDEMWHFLWSKKQGPGLEGLWPFPAGTAIMGNLSAISSTSVCR